MPEEQVTGSKTPLLDKEQQGRSLRIRRIRVIGIVAASAVAILSLALFFQMHTWQMQAVAAGILVLMAVMLVWMLMRVYRGITTIRTRLIAGFLLVVILPFVFVTAAITVGNVNASRQTAIQQLGSVATLKGNQVDEWVQRLRGTLAIVMADDEALATARTMTTEPSDSAAYQSARASFSNRFHEIIQKIQLFQELFMLDAKGQVIVSTDPLQEGLFKADREYFQQGLELKARDIYVSPPFLSPTLHEMTVVAVRPILDQDGNLVALLAGRASMDVLRDLMQQRPGLGNTAETYLVGEDGTLLTGIRFLQGETTIRSQGILRLLREKLDFEDATRNYANTPVLGMYRWLPQLRVGLIAEEAESEAYQGTYAMLGIIGIVALLALGLAVLAAVVITRGIANPLTNLAHTAERIAGGDLSLTAPVAQRDEIGLLAQAFNSMTARLRNSISNLESQVHERTEQLSASAEVGRAVSSILDVSELLGAVVDLIAGRFGYYYVAVFIVEETGRYAVLQGATGETGRILKERHHQLDLSGVSMVGSAITTGEPRIALHADEEKARFANPLLPETRSEIALPLRLGGRVIGALDVQSVQPNAFNEASAAVLQSMADQIAVTLGNARLYGEVQQRARQQESLARVAALAGLTLDVNELLDRLMAEARQVFGAQVAVALLEDKAQQALIGRHVSSEGTPTTASVEWQVPMSTPGFEQSLFARGGSYFSNQALDDPNVIPAYLPYMEALNVRNFCGVALRVRDQSLGELYVANRPQGFGKNDIGLLQTIAGYAANAIQNAQLFEQAQELAFRERTLNTIAARIRAGFTLDQLLQSTVQEIGHHMHAARVAVRLNLPGGDGKPPSSVGSQRASSSG